MIKNKLKFVLLGLLYSIIVTLVCYVIGGLASHTFKIMKWHIDIRTGILTFYPILLFMGWGYALHFVYENEL